MGEICKKGQEGRLKWYGDVMRNIQERARRKVKVVRRCHEKYTRKGKKEG